MNRSCRDSINKRKWKRLIKINSVSTFIFAGVGDRSELISGATVTFINTFIAAVG